MDPAAALYTIRIHGHLGATVLSAFPALVPQRHGADTSSHQNANHQNQVTATHRADH
jgi:hypothetical protein